MKSCWNDLQVSKLFPQFQVRLQGKMSWSYAQCGKDVRVRVCVCVRERETVRERERELRALIGLGWFWKAVGNCRINVSYLTVVYFYSLFTDGSVMCNSEINFYTRLFNCSLFCVVRNISRATGLTWTCADFGIFASLYPKEGIFHRLFISHIVY